MTTEQFIEARKLSQEITYLETHIIELNRLLDSPTEQVYPMCIVPSIMHKNETVLSAVEHANRILRQEMTNKLSMAQEKLAAI